MSAGPTAFSSNVTSVLPTPVANPFAMREPSENVAENPIPRPAETGEVKRVTASKTDNREKSLFFILYYSSSNIKLILEFRRKGRIISYNNASISR
jgi:hypothetical protein